MYTVISNWETESSRVYEICNKAFVVHTLHTIIRPKLSGRKSLYGHKPMHYSYTCAVFNEKAPKVEALIHMHM